MTGLVPPVWDLPDGDGLPPSLLADLQDQIRRDRGSGGMRLAGVAAAGPRERNETGIPPRPSGVKPGFHPV
jgi:hypothetical protein